MGPVEKRLRDAQKYLEHHGWCQGPSHSGCGKVCILNAVDFVGRDSITFSEALEMLRVTLGGTDLVKWNDAPGRFERSVHNLLFAAARVAQERGL
jgi:hypothetical protein